MKRYTSIGELLVDYRNRYSISQSDFAAEFDVDVRTIIRWEKNETLLKPEKEEALVDITFIPYQVVRNLNAPVSIPTYYDFVLRRYALSSLSNQLPEAGWLKERLNVSTNRIRTIQYNSDIENILRCALLQEHIKKTIDIRVVKKAVELLPEINLILFSASNYYSGHALFLPLSNSCYNKLKNREMIEEEITVNDLIDIKNEAYPIYYAYDINADCNESLFYLSGEIIKYFKTIDKNYVYGAFVSRTDSFSINNQLGIKIVWEDKSRSSKDADNSVPRFYEGNFSKYLSK